MVAKWGNIFILFLMFLGNIFVICFSLPSAPESLITLIFAGRPSLLNWQTTLLSSPSRCSLVFSREAVWSAAWFTYLDRPRVTETICFTPCWFPVLRTAFSHGPSSTVVRALLHTHRQPYKSVPCLPTISSPGSWRQSSCFLPASWATEVRGHPVFSTLKMFISAPEKFFIHTIKSIQI